MPTEEPDYPGDHHDPPEDLREKELPLVETSGPFFRLYPMGYGPIHFGKGCKNRFDDPERRFGVLYAAERVRGAFIETYGRRLGMNVVTEAALKARGLVEIRSDVPLRLVDLKGPSAARIGVDGRLFSGSHGVSRRWSGAFHGHPSSPDGLRYPARHDNDEPAVALYDRVEDKLSATDRGMHADPANLAELNDALEYYWFGLIQPPSDS